MDIFKKVKFKSYYGEIELLALQKTILINDKIRIKFDNFYDSKYKSKTDITGIVKQVDTKLLHFKDTILILECENGDKIKFKSNRKRMDET